ncbi:TonB-dependent receptor [Novosphingobium sp. KACC 22771]|uniref:TonB-dependent receptor n=1 Tax=Novosphingobium sp. KACC 22771 TaxID=3025670 RepID=UPI0023657949|nr:TonB-dependent receptor [Novosphingobium sp. KACC 22771]WDF75001.1 TonB-dependent receptor [Novosphingobium sp. KACC 22771]
MTSTQRAHRVSHMRNGLSAGLAMSALLMASPALAQDGGGAASARNADAPPPGEIVVTATRKAQSLSRVPASVVAKSSVELDTQGVRSIADIAQVTPGITFGQSAVLYGTGQTSIAIRGIDSASGIPTTGVYIDDTPVQTRVGVSPSLSNPYPQVFDLDRVEVLRGPQGTLFGSGSVGGAVRFIMPKPSYDKISMYDRAEVGTTHNGAASYEGGVALGAPIVTDKIGFRVSAWTRHDGGYIDRLDRTTKQVTQKDINSSDTVSLRLAVGARATDRLTITPSIFYQYQNIADGSRFEVAASDLAHADQRLSLNTRPERHRDDFYLPALKVELDLGRATLVSDTSYFHRTTRTQSDDATLSLTLFGGVVGTIPSQFQNYAPGTQSHTIQKSFTQELRLQNNNANDRFNWIVGLFYQRSFVQDQYAGSDPQLLDVVNYAQAQSGNPPYTSLMDAYGVDLYQGQFSVFQRNTHRDQQMAAYAQADYEVVPRLKLTLGGRYTIAKYQFEGFTAGPLYTTPGRTDSLGTTSHTFTPRLGVTFQADPRNMFYVSAAKGVRGPGVSPPVGLTCTSDAAAIGFDPLASLNVKPDSIWSYEAGSKNRLFGGKLAMDASIYHIDWNNVQTLLALPTCSIYAALNLGSAKVDGFDLAVTLRPVRSLTLGASVAYTNARYTSAIPGPNGTTIRKAGEPFAVAPWSFQLNGEFTQPIGGIEGYARADFSYNSHNGKPVDVNSPLVDPALPRPPATSQLDLRVGGRIKADWADLDLSLYANNVTDSQPIMALYHDSPISTWYRAGSFRPRTIGLTLTARK